uniref:flagellar biosynthesis protein FlhA n=1 Tax=Eubacterium cellulosolvens TaxID=29322 RepID=UPI0004877675|nr:flagellar biosynthesis protein FlhA [[Eubacterium] cellulosolvens]
MAKIVKQLLSNSVTLMVLVIVLMMIIPIPPSMIDIFILINMALSMMIMIITMSIHEPLEFSIFPTLLLVTTLLRLGVNVSTTRNILSNGGGSGQVIKSFGDFVLQGNVVVGMIIYIIIVLMNFLVINKGAERVAEVAARFNLDAMPGKQMAIDSDMSTGLIDEKEAAIRRSKVQREADFYGSMDGATKIVKGDATMSLITTAINLVGGIIIGMVQGGGDLATVAATYSIATVGDGLVGQIPSLLISTSTGMIVTRAVAEGSLNEDISREFLAQPKAFTIAGIAITALTIVPGMPVFYLIMVGGILVAIGLFLTKKMGEQPEIGRSMEVFGNGPAVATATAGGVGDVIPATAVPPVEPVVSEEDYFKDVSNVYKLLAVEPIELDFGYSLIPLADESIGGRLISRIVIFRRQYAQDMGFVVPSIRLRDSSSLGTNEYMIKVKGEEVARGEILTDYFLALEADTVNQQIDGIDTIEPAYGIPSKWIRPENREKAELYGYTVIDPLSVMVSHLSEVIKAHAYELVTRQEVVRLVDNLKETAPELVEEVIGNVISYNLLQRVLTQLLSEGIAIKDLETIVETMATAIADNGMQIRDVDSITEQVRVALKRTITRMYCEDGNMRVITLDADLERTMVDSLAKGENGYYLALSPDILQSVVRQVSDETRKFIGLDQAPVILTSQVMRVHFYHMIGQFYPNVRVLSFNEVANNVQIQSIGSLKLEAGGMAAS